jgi:protein HIRA/HIR1
LVLLHWYCSCLVMKMLWCCVREADEARLRELCEELLGPTYAVDSSCPASPCSKHNKKQWNPEILGMKKRELLKSEVLPAMASNRAIQRLLNEFVDLLSECKGLATDTQPTARSNFENS